MENTALTELISDKESHTYQLIRLNDYSHLRELRTLGYEKWGLFAARDYWAKQPNFSFPGDLQQMQEPACFINYNFLSIACRFIIAIIWLCMSSTVSILIRPILFLIISKSMSGNILSHKRFASGDAPIKAVTSELASNCLNTSLSSFSEIVEICSKSVILCGCMLGSNKYSTSCLFR